MARPAPDLRSFEGLREIVATLRGPDGCPWDKEQTHQSLKPYLLEEACETLEALDDGDHAHLSEELGDLLLQVLMHSQIAQEAGEFTLEDVIANIAAKLVRRHPHVFGQERLENAGQVVTQWDEIKKQERGEDSSALAGVPAILPALAQAQALQRRTVRDGFAWENAEQAWDKLAEELQELREASTADERLHETGDTLFALAEVARWLDIDAEEALRLTSRRFKRSFHQMEERLRERGQGFAQLNPDEKLALWKQAKQPSP